MVMKSMLTETMSRYCCWRQCWWLRWHWRWCWWGSTDRGMCSMMMMMRIFKMLMMRMKKGNTDWGVCTMMMMMMVMMKKNHRQRGVYYWVSETERSINQCSPLDPQTQDDAGDPHDDGGGWDDGDHDGGDHQSVSLTNLISRCKLVRGPGQLL